MSNEQSIVEGGSAIDDRGKVAFINSLDFSGIKRFYMVSNHRVGFIRAFHYHKYEAKYVFVVSGAIKLVVAKIEGAAIPETATIKDVSEYILSEDKPKLLYIPPDRANGFKTLTPGARAIFYSTSTLEESLSDDIRYPYDLYSWEERYR